MISLKGIIHEAAGKVLESLSAFLKRIVIVSGPIFEWHKPSSSIWQPIEIAPNSLHSFSLSVSIQFTFTAKNVCNELLAYSFMLYAASLLTIARCFLLLSLSARIVGNIKYGHYVYCFRRTNTHTRTHRGKWHAACCKLYCNYRLSDVAGNSQLK